MKVLPRCLRCNNYLQTFEVKCSYCHKDIVSDEEAVKLKKYIEDIERCDDEISSSSNNTIVAKAYERKISRIKNYSIPRTKKELWFYFNLISEELLDSAQINCDYPNGNNKRVFEVCRNKFNETYRTVCAYIENDPDFPKYQTIYDDTNSQYKIINKASQLKQAKHLFENKTILSFICLLVVIIIGGIIEIYHKTELKQFNDDLSSLKDEVNNGNYDLVIEEADDVSLPLLIFPKDKSKLKVKRENVVNDAVDKKIAEMINIIKQDILERNSEKAFDDIKNLCNEVNRLKSENEGVTINYEIDSLTFGFTVDAKEIELITLSDEIDELIEAKDFSSARQKADNLVLDIDYNMYPEYKEKYTEWSWNRRNKIIEIEDLKCKDIESEIEKCLLEKKVEDAASLLENLYMDSQYGDEKESYWEERKEQLAAEIDKKTHSLNGTALIILDFSSEDIEGDNYESVMIRFKNLGFENIELNPVYDLWNASKQGGKVEWVSINGEKQFQESKSCRYDDKIIITYHDLKKNAPDK